MTARLLTVPSDLRAAIRDTLRQIDVLADQRELVGDLAFHAVEQALGAIEDVASRAGSFGGTIAVMSGALSITGPLCAHYLRSIVDAGKELGAQTATSTFTTPGSTK